MTIYEYTDQIRRMQHISQSELKAQNLLIISASTVTLYGYILFSAGSSMTLIQLASVSSPAIPRLCKSFLTVPLHYAAHTLSSVSLANLVLFENPELLPTTSAFYTASQKMEHQTRGNNSVKS